MENNIFCFWTGENNMSQNRKKSLKLLPIQTECKITFVTPDNLHTYIKKDNPLHPAYDYLSEVHKSDYLRIYFMKFYGGGYHDIKQATGSWVDSFSSLKKSDKQIMGFAEGKYGPNKFFRRHWKKLIGTSAFICKKDSMITNDWYSKVVSLLDKKHEKLKKHPSMNPRDKTKEYPLFWSELLGNIFHEVLLSYPDQILNSLPRPVCKDYL
jgi:hypothetical protein